MDIFDAIIKNNIQSVKTNINQDPSVIHHRNNSRQAPLHTACLYNRTETAQWLINAGTDVHVKDKNGWTPLHFACRYSHIETAQLLINAGSDVFVKDKAGRTPLHWACHYGCTEITQLLIDAGADIHTKDNNGWTPLHLACDYGHTTVAQSLIRTSVDCLTIVNLDNRTPVDLAIYRRNKKLLIFLASMIDQLPESERKQISAWRFRQELTKTS